jgi:hypothetical protein
MWAGWDAWATAPALPQAWQRPEPVRAHLVAALSDIPSHVDARTVSALLQAHLDRLPADVFAGALAEAAALRTARRAETADAAMYAVDATIFRKAPSPRGS